VQYLRRILAALADPIDRGIPVIVLEPSCASVFRDELRSLLPDDARAGKLRAQTFLLSEFLERKVPGYVPPKLSRRVMLHGHCHHKAILKMGDEESILRKTGAELQSLDSGCCGMAGPFGMDAHKYDVSMAIGERVLLPAVRGADAETIVVSDGFSCREQIAQSTGRHALHLAEVARLALARDHVNPELGARERTRQTRRRALRTATTIGVATAAVAAVVAVASRKAA